MKEKTFIYTKVLLVSSAIFWLWNIHAWAGESSHKYREERHQIRADALRERAKIEARSQLRYEDVYVPYDYRYQDLFYIGQQIRRLGDLIQGIADPTGTVGGEYAGPVTPWLERDVGNRNREKAAPDRSALVHLYGPNGPTERSVRLILEYRLMVTGNPRLAVGEIKDQGDAITAEVITVDGSLVDKYTIDKKSGGWKPVR